MLLGAYCDTILAIVAKTRQHSHISIAVDLVLKPPGHPEKIGVAFNIFSEVTK